MVRRFLRQLLLTFVSFRGAGNSPLVGKVDEFFVAFFVVFVLMGGHVASEVVAFAEALVAHRAFEFILIASTFVRIDDVVVVLVMRAHMIDEIGGHAEMHVALGANVLRW